MAIAYVFKENDMLALSNANVELYVNGHQRTAPFTLNVRETVKFTPKTNYRLAVDDSGKLKLKFYSVDYGYYTDLKAGLDGSVTWFANQAIDESDPYDERPTNWDTFTVETVYSEPPPITAYEFSLGDMALLEKSNVVLSVNGVNKTEPFTLLVGDLVKFTPNHNYSFTVDTFGNISIRLYNSNHEIYTKFQMDAVGAVNWVAIQADSVSTRNYEAEAWNSLTCSTLYTEPLPPEVSGRVLPNNVYLMPEPILKQFNNNVFTISNTSGKAEDYSKYIINLIRLPFELSKAVLGDDRKIALSNYKMNVTTQSILTDVASLDLGSITVLKETNNFLDYNNTIAILNLPFSEPITLDLNLVLGEVISVKYDVNLYNGIASVLVYSSAVGGLVYSKNVDLGVNIPIHSGVGNSVIIKEPDIELGLDNGIKTPYIEIHRNDAILADGFFTAPIVAEGLLGDCEGFTVIENVNLISKTNLNDREKIESMLKQGVIFK